MAYVDIYNTIFLSTELRARVMVAISKAAMNVLNEPMSPNKIKRVEWANSALANIDIITNKMIWPIASNQKVLDGTATDSDVQALVDVLINTFVGV